MDDISDLLKEAKPLYFRRKRIRNLTKAAGVLSIAAFLAFGTFQRADNYVYDFDNMSSTISMLQNGSARYKKFEALLTPEQKAKLEAHKKHHEKEFKGGKNRRLSPRDSKVSPKHNKD